MIEPAVVVEKIVISESIDSWLVVLNIHILSRHWCFDAKLSWTTWKSYRMKLIYLYIFGQSVYFEFEWNSYEMNPTDQTFWAQTNEDHLCLYLGFIYVQIRTRLRPLLTGAVHIRMPLTAFLTFSSRNIPIRTIMHRSWFCCAAWGRAHCICHHVDYRSLLPRECVCAMRRTATICSHLLRSAGRLRFDGIFPWKAPKVERKAVLLWKTCSAIRQVTV